MHMNDWVRNILSHAGTVTHALAVEHAEREFSGYKAAQRQREALEPTSDFDKALEQVKSISRTNRRTKR